MLYSSHISWNSPTTPAPLELYPALAFDRLFKGGVQRGDKSVLDAVLADANDFRQQISASDQRKLDEYLDSVREVEQRIEQAGKKGELQGWRPSLTKSNIPRPAEGIPQNIAEHMRLMCDILVLAFQTDTTRIVTLKLNNDHSSLRFPHLGVDYMIHHLLSHSDTADWLKVNQFFVGQLAYVAGKLDKVREGERTALDNSVLLFCSSMLTGNHDATQLPVGLRDVEANKPMTADTIFRIASMTKPITSAAVMMLVDDGKVALADPVSKYLPEFRDPKVLVRREEDGKVTWETRKAKREITIH